MTTLAPVATSDAERTGAPRRPLKAPEEPRGVAYRLQLAAISLFLTFIAFIQSPGLIWSDSKIDLATEPAAFLARALRLWEPLSGAGQLQNQAYGYLFPMGPWFAFWDAVGLPTWMSQRGWLALLLVASFLGVVRLAGAMQLGTPWTRMVGALAYTLAPRMLTILGPISSEALPMVLLPWALLPLVRGAAGEISPRRAAGLFGLAVVCMGGVNATATLAVLPLPALFLLTRAPSATRRSLLGWSALATLLATAWWVIPLVLLGAYSFPFLDYVETAAATTSRTSLIEVLRGTSHWVGYLEVNGQPWWQAAQPLVSNPVVVIQTALLAGLGLAGMARRSLPNRRFLVLGLLVGLAAVTLGHLGPFTGPWSPAVQDALDGVLAPFRNVHKFDPLIRLPLALGAAHWLSVVVTSRHRATAVALCGVLLLGVASPALTGRLGPAGAFESVPSYWQDAAAWLTQADPDARTLLLPGDGFGQFTWGRTVDEPIQPYAGAPWWVRQQAAALPGTGGTRLLDSIEAVVDKGRPAPGLADVLARSGVHYVLVRNDLDWSHTGAPRPSAVAATMEQSPGLTLVAEFGPLSGGETIGTAVVDSGIGRPRPALQVYEVRRRTAPVVVQDADHAVVLSGGPEQLLDLSAQGLLAPSQAVVLAADSLAGSVPAAKAVVSDGLARRLMTFGQIRNNVSETYTKDRAFEVRTPDLAPVVSGTLRPADLTGHAAVARFLGISDVRASSSASDPGAVLEGDVSRSPFAPLDTISRTVWLSGAITAAGQWWEVDFSQPRSLGPTLPVTIVGSSLLKTDVTRIRVTTSTGAVDTTVDGSGAVKLLVPPGLTRSLRIEAVQFGRDQVTKGMFGLGRVDLAGLAVARTLVAADDLPASLTTPPTILLAGGDDRSDGCIVLAGAPLCSEGLQQTGEEAGVFDRTFTTRVAGTFDLRVSASPSDGASAEAAARGRDPWGGAVKASSTLTRGAGTSAAAARDGDPATTWLAGRSDLAPSLTYTWPAEHVVSGVRMLVAGDANVSAPRRIRVTMGGHVEEAWLTPRVAGPPGHAPGSGGGVLEARFPALAGTSLEIMVIEQQGRGDVEPTYGGLRRLPVGVSEVSLLGGDGRVVASPGQVEDQATSANASLPCGTVSAVVDGVPVALEGSQTLEARVRGETTVLRACGTGRPLTLAPGTHRITWPSGPYEVRGLVLAPEGAEGNTSTGGRQVSISAWNSDRRSVEVSAGSASLLVVHENANAGWRAVADGHVLEPVVVDGWQQAWKLPASGAVRVELEYMPARQYHVGLLVGLLLALALIGLVVIPGRPKPSTGEASGRLATTLVVGVATGLIVFLSGPWGAAAAAIGFVVALRRPDRRDVLILGLVGASGCVAACALVWRSPWPSAVQALSQPAVLAALGAVVASLLPRSLSHATPSADAPERGSDAPARTS